MWQGAGRYPWQIQCLSGGEPGRYLSPRRRKGSRGQLRSCPQPHCRQGRGQGAHCKAGLNYGAVPLQSRERGQQEQPQHGAGLAPNPPSPGARDGAWRGDGGLPSPCLLGLAPFPTCLGTIWCLLYLFCCGSGRRAGFHCLREEVGRRTGTCPCPAGCPEPGLSGLRGSNPRTVRPRNPGGGGPAGAGCRPSTLAAAELSTPERGAGWGRNAWQRRPDSSQPGSAAATGMLGEPSTEK